MTITFKELRRRLSESTRESVYIYDPFEEWFNLFESGTFYIYRVDTGAILARNIQGFESAKRKASEPRRTLGLRFDNVKFKSQRSGSGSTGILGVSNSGKTFANNKGERYPIQYSRNYNPSKRGRFTGYYDKHGNFHGLS